METPAPMPHLGKWLKAFMKKNRLSKAALARFMEVAPAQLQYYLRTGDLKVSVLFKISHAYQHNFLADLAAHFPPHYVLEKPASTAEETIAALETELKAVTAERDLLKEVLKG